MIDGTRPQILAVLVLYGRTAEESPAFVVLKAFSNHVEGRGKIALSIFDNSPVTSETPANFSGRYVAYPSNPGLAGPYNDALIEAEQRGIPWLMLLDQDTEITQTYLHEALHETTVDGPAALVPRLLSNGHLLSPHVPSYWPRSQPLTTTVRGVATRRLHYFNSGAVLRVSAVRRIGGFPNEFSLDYLDHAVFFQLQKLGLPILILHSGLEHHLSTMHPSEENDADWVRREEVALRSAVTYYSRYERGHRLLQHRIQLLFAALRYLIAGKTAQAKRFAKAAVFRIEGAKYVG